MIRKLFTEREEYIVFACTVGVILVNYVSYSGREYLLLTHTIQPASLIDYLLITLSYPIHLYIEVYETRFLLPIRYVGRILNYLVELGYFVVLTTSAYLFMRRFVRFAMKKNI